MKVFVTRDEANDWVWLWKSPTKGNWEPQKKKDCDMVVWEREDLDHADAYLTKDFKKKFGFTPAKRSKKNIKLDDKLVNNEDYKLFSNDGDRKK
jgi:hypothetical protein